MIGLLGQGGLIFANWFSMMIQSVDDSIFDTCSEGGKSDNIDSGLCVVSCNIFLF